MKPVVAYAHNFERYFWQEGRQVDRLAQILQHGILSPREAAKRNLPHKTNINIIMTGVENYNNVVFLFPVFDLAKPPLWPNGISVILDKSLEVLTVEEMTARQNGNWAQLSHFYGGEFYRLGSITTEYFWGIILPNSNGGEIGAAEKLIKKYVPTAAGRIKVSVA